MMLKVKAYPWKYRFHRGYSGVDIEAWEKELSERVGL